MPMTFPSHQGLVAPLWRRWPDRFDIAALCVGAAMPDIVDALSAVARGRFGQGFGHSLVGAASAGLLIGWLVRSLLLALARRSRSWNFGGPVGFLIRHAAAAVLGGPAGGRDRRARGLIVLASLATGIASHLLFDLVSHGGFPWLLPWVPKRIRIYPEWWYDTWIRIPSPWRSAGRNVGPPAILWAALSAWGAWSLIAPTVAAWRGRRGGGRPPSPHVDSAARPDGGG